MVVLVLVVVVVVMTYEMYEIYIYIDHICPVVIDKQNILEINFILACKISVIVYRREAFFFLVSTVHEFPFRHALTISVFIHVPEIIL